MLPFYTQTMRTIEVKKSHTETTCLRLRSGRLQLLVRIVGKVVEVGQVVGIGRGCGVSGAGRGGAAACVAHRPGRQGQAHSAGGEGAARPYRAARALVVRSYLLLIEMVAFRLKGKEDFYG